MLRKTQQVIKNHFSAEIYAIKKGFSNKKKATRLILHSWLCNNPCKKYVGISQQLIDGIG